MIIRKLVLHNFGIYAGTNEFTFDGIKKVGPEKFFCIYRE